MRCLRFVKQFHANRKNEYCKKFPMDFKIDTSGLLQGPPLPENASDPSESLMSFFKSLVEVRGPFSVHEFMKHSLTHPDFGYYTKKKSVIGKSGDFTTSPEISQMFGELIGVWCVALWQQMQCPKKLHIVELGPGKGTLMSDLLSASVVFSSFFDAITVHFVEISPEMRRFQRDAIKSGKGMPSVVDEVKSEHGDITELRFDNGLLVHWHYDISTVPKEACCFIAQEFFDAMPVHQFEYTEKGWCERLVDMDGDKVKFVLSNGPTAAVQAYLGNVKMVTKERILTELDEMGELKKALMMDDANVGDRCEVSPPSIAIVQDITKRIAMYGGGALIVDYGHDNNPQDSLRGILDHKFVSPLENPGNSDLSIDVDFSTLKKYASNEKDIAVHGPITQGQFLQTMGIEHRLEALLNNCDDVQGAELVKSCERLVQPNEMGSIFKAMAIVPKKLGAPAGF